MKSQISLHSVRLHAIEQAVFALKYPGRGKERSTSSLNRLIDYCMKKSWRLGWNACASFSQSFPEGERLDERLRQGGFDTGLRIKV
jgi:hypothetical protein